MAIYKVRFTVTRTYTTIVEAADRQEARSHVYDEQTSDLCESAELEEAELDVDEIELEDEDEDEDDYQDEEF